MLSMGSASNTEFSRHYSVRHFFIYEQLIVYVLQVANAITIQFAVTYFSGVSTASYLYFILCILNYEIRDALESYMIMLLTGIISCFE